MGADPQKIPPSVGAAVRRTHHLSTTAWISPISRSIFLRSLRRPRSGSICSRSIFLRMILSPFSPFPKTAAEAAPAFAPARPSRGAAAHVIARHLVEQSVDQQQPLPRDRMERLRHDDFFPRANTGRHGLHLPEADAAGDSNRS